MNDSIAISRPKELQTLQRAHWFYRIAAILGPLVLLATLFDLIRKEPHAIREVSLALLIVIVGVPKYFELTKKMSVVRALGEK